MVEKQGLRLNPVAHGHEWKVRAEWLARDRVDSLRSGRAITRPDDVGADDRVAAEVEDSMFAEQLGPPVADARRTGERVTDQNRVIAALVQLAVNRVTQVDGPQRAARFERERLVFGKDEIAFVVWLNRLKHSSRFQVSGGRFQVSGVRYESVASF